MQGSMAMRSNPAGIGEDICMAVANGDSCVNYVYDEDYESYSCMVNLDEDEMFRFLSGDNRECPYYRLDDEYAVVRHQI